MLLSLNRTIRRPLFFALGVMFGAVHVFAQASIVPATGLHFPNGVAFDQSGNLYITDYDGGSPDDPTIYGIPAAIEISTSGTQRSIPTSGVDSPYGIAVDPVGNVYVADEAHNRIVKITPQGNQSTVANVAEVQTVALDGQGNLFAVDLLNSALVRIDSQGRQFVLASPVNTRSIAADANGNVYGEDAVVGALLKWDSQGHQTALLSNVSGLFDFGGVAVDKAGDVFFTTVNSALKLDAFHTLTTVIGGLSQPQALAIDPNGSLAIADTGNARVLKVSTSLTVTLVSSGGGVYNYDVTGSPGPGCPGPCFNVMHGQQATFSGMSGVTGASVLTSSLLNECYTVTSTSNSSATFTETVDPVGCSGVFDSTMHAFQIVSSSTTVGPVQFSIQTSAGTFTGTTLGPVSGGPQICQVSLKVPYFNQADPLWNPPLYPGAYNYLTNPPVIDLPPGTTAAYIKEYGCLLSSLAMALQYAGATTLPGSPAQPLDPGTLNTFWEAIPGVYTSGHIVNDTGNIDPTVGTTSVSNADRLNLKFVPTSTPGSSLPQDLDNLLCGANPIPVIVQVADIKNCVVQSSTKTSHYVLVTGRTVDGSGVPHYTINDPGCRRFTTLDAYNNQFNIRGVVVDPIDQSNMTFVVENTADLLVTDSVGQKTGFDPATGNVIQQIPGSGHFVDSISNDLTGAPPLGQTYSVQVFNPSSQTYLAQLSGIVLGTFTVSINTIASDGTIQPRGLYQGVASPGSRTTLQVRMPVQTGAAPVLVTFATFESTIRELRDLSSLGLIDGPGIANSLLAKIEAASAAVAHGESVQASNQLRAFLREIAAQAGKHITLSAAEMLVADANSLLVQIEQPGTSK